jgi:hypothetical protein
MTRQASQVSESRPFGNITGTVFLSAQSGALSIIQPTSKSRLLFPNQRRNRRGEKLTQALIDCYRDVKTK